jgi:hypothetical protein
MNPILTVAAAGLAINVVDVGTTLAFAARLWTAELARQGIAPNPLTPPFYILANVVGAGALYLAILSLSPAWGPGPMTGLVAALFVWGITRLYGLGHVVMRQMPLRLFLIMSAGLGGGYMLAGQLILWLIT